MWASPRIFARVLIGNTSMAAAIPRTAPTAVSSIRNSSRLKANSPSRPYIKASMVLIQKVIRL